MTKLSAWLSAFRLRTLPLSISGILVASCMAKYNGVFNGNLFALAMLTTISYQILSNLANDYGDGVKGTDNNNRIGPKRAIQSGAISASKMRKALRINVGICITLTIALVFYAFSGTHKIYLLAFLLLGGVSIIAAIKYTVGKKAYGYSGKGDIFVFLFFGLISVIGGYVLYAKQIDAIVILPAIAIGLLSVAVLNLNNMRDINSDKVSNKITLAVKLGLKKAKKYHYFLVITALILLLLFSVLYYSSLFNFSYIIIYIPLIIHLNKVAKTTNPKHFDPELKKVALSTFFIALFLGVGYLL